MWSSALIQMNYLTLVCRNSVFVLNFSLFVWFWYTFIWIGIAQRDVPSIDTFGGLIIFVRSAMFTLSFHNLLSLSQWDASLSLTLVHTHSRTHTLKCIMMQTNTLTRTQFGLGFMFQCSQCSCLSRSFLLHLFMSHHFSFESLSFWIAIGLLYIGFRYWLHLVWLCKCTFARIFVFFLDCWCDVSTTVSMMLNSSSVTSICSRIKRNEFDVWIGAVLNCANSVSPELLFCCLDVCKHLGHLCGMPKMKSKSY